MMRITGTMKNSAVLFKRYGRILSLIGLIVLGVVNIMTYSNLHLHLKAKRDIGNLTQKIQILDKANHSVPFNDGVYHELGKAYFQLGMKNIGRPQQRDSYLFRALENLVISVRLNPGYYQTHFHLAQAMMYMNYFSNKEYDYIAEFKKAALLNNFDQEAYFEVGRILLSKWPELSPEDRNFCLTILKKITEKAGMAEMRSIIQVWAAVVKDYRVMDALLPKSSRLYRMYAGLLGEISMDIEERRLKMAEAEQMEFTEADEAQSKAQAALRFFRLNQAEDFFSTALDKLENIRFYQSLAGISAIDSERLSELKKSIRMGLLKTKIALKKPFAEMKDLFCTVVIESKSQDRLKELEDFLLKNNVIDRNRMPDISDLDLILCRLTLDFARHRYQDIIRFGENLKMNPLLSEAESNGEYARIFELLGDSYNKLDYMYDAGEFYKRALMIDARNADILFKMLAHYERLNKKMEAEGILKRLDQLLTPSEISIRNSGIIKGQLFHLPLRIEHEAVELTLFFEGITDADPALLSVYFNGPVIFEHYVPKNNLTLTLKPRPGLNLLEMRAVNRNIQIVKISWQPLSSPSVQ
jgi:hypothetical protein